MQYFLIIVDQLKDVYLPQFPSLTRVLEVAGSLSSAAIQETCLKVDIKLELFIQASRIASWERGLSGGMFSYLGWITIDKRLLNWAKVRWIPSITEKGQQNTCLHTLQARIHFPVSFNKLNTKQQGVSLLCGRKIAGGTELCVSCIPAKSENFAKYLFGWLKKWIVPIFHKKSKTTQQYLPA